MDLIHALLNNKKWFIFFFIVIRQDIVAQNTKLESINETKTKKLLIKAKTNKDFIQITNAYKSLIYSSDKKLSEKYADSMLIAAKQTNDNSIIGSAYLTKGTLDYNQKNHSRALDNFIIANNYISRTEDDYLKFKTKYTIAQIKHYLGFYEEAIALFRECLLYFEIENDYAYLSTLHSIGLCFNKIGNPEKTTFYNQLGLKTSIEYENLEVVPYFKHSEGINEYSKKNYKKAIIELEKVLPSLQQKKDFANETVAYFYIGKSHWALHHEERAISFFVKVDDAFLKYNYIRPDLRENYELLIDYYKKHNNPLLQLKYIDRLLKVDSILNHNYKYLSKRIFKEYDTKKLTMAKQEIEQAMITNNRIHYSLIVSLSGAILFLGWRHTRNKKRYKQKFEELMNEKVKPEKTIQNSNAEITFEINPELVKAILQNLEKFEKNKKYLEKDMTLIKLSGYLKTNPKYASKIILKYRGKKIIEYISDLKIDYIVEKLKTENKYRNYTYKALAEEAGFGSTQNFTKAFNTRLEMPPTFFIQQLKNSFPL